MTLIHTLCLKTLEMQRRTIVSRPVDRTWPTDFSMELPFCVVCGVFPPQADIKREVDTDDIKG